MWTSIPFWQRTTQIVLIWLNLKIFPKGVSFYGKIVYMCERVRVFERCNVRDIVILTGQLPPPI